MISCICKRLRNGTAISCEVQKRTDEESIKLNPDFERYVRVYSKSFAEIYGNALKDSNADKNELEGLVKISYKGKTIYRKCIGASIEKGIVEMGYRTKSELNAEYEKPVRIEPACWFCFYWNNSESYIKYPFKIALCSAVITVISFLLGITSVCLDIMSLNK